MSIEFLRQVARYMDGDRAAGGRFALVCRGARWTDMPESVLRARLVDPPDPSDYAALVAYGAEHAAFERLCRKPSPVNPTTASIARAMKKASGFAWADILTLPELNAELGADGRIAYGVNHATAATHDPAVVVADRIWCTLRGTMAIGSDCWSISKPGFRSRYTVCRLGWSPVSCADVRALVGWLGPSVDRWIALTSNPRFLVWTGPNVARASGPSLGISDDHHMTGIVCAVERNRVSLLHYTVPE